MTDRRSRRPPRSSAERRRQQDVRRSRSPTRWRASCSPCARSRARQTAARAISLLLLEISQVLLAGARLGAQQRLHPARASTSPTSAPRPTSTRCGCGSPTMLDGVDTYSFVFDPYVPELVESQLSDDLTSIATDLENGLRHFRAGDVAEALWWWQFSYVSSWGNLAGARAQRAAVGGRPRPARRRVRPSTTSRSPPPMRYSAATRRPLGRLAGGRSAAWRARSGQAAVSERPEDQPWALSCRSTAAPPSPTPTASSASPSASSSTKQGRPRRRRRRLRDGRHHRRAARPRRAGDAAAAAARARHAAHRRRADLDGAGRDGDRRPRPQGAARSPARRPA